MFIKLSLALFNKIRQLFEKRGVNVIFILDDASNKFLDYEGDHVEALQIDKFGVILLFAFADIFDHRHKTP